MKKILLSFSILLGLNSYSQNTIPTTTCTGALKVNDSLNVNKDIISNGDILAKGEVTATDTLRAKEDVIAQKNIKVEGSVYIGNKLEVNGQSVFGQELSIKKSILFDGGNEFSYSPATSTSNAKFYLGNSAAKVLPWAECQTPNTNTVPQFLHNGAFISRMPIGSGTGLTDASLTFQVAPWNGMGMIEVSGVGNTGVGDNGLSINEFCKRNTYINMGWDMANGVNGGRVFLGAEVDMMRSLKIGWNGAANLIDQNTAIEINQNTNNAKGVNVKTWNAGIKAFAIESADGKNTFVVFGDGRTRIGPEKIISGPHTDAMLSVSGKIACKEVRVFNTTNYWADFVFDKNYKLMDLTELEKFYNRFNHLPGVPSANEIQNNGNDLAKTDAILLQKIEELTIYIVELNKKIEILEKKSKK